MKSESSQVSQIDEIITILNKDIKDSKDLEERSLAVKTLQDFVSACSSIL